MDSLHVWLVLASVGAAGDMRRPELDVLLVANVHFVDRMSMAMTLGIGLFIIAIGISATTLPGLRKDQ
jgi:hypothetical protein